MKYISRLAARIATMILSQVDGKIVSKLILLTGSFSVLLAIFTVLTTSVIYVSPFEWGLMAKLPISFWMGLTFLLLFVWLGRKSGRCMAIGFLLTIVYLYGIPTFIEVNPRFPVSYHPFSEGILIAQTGRLESDPFILTRYHNHPMFLYLVAILTIMTRLSGEFMMKWFPLFNITFFGFCVQLIFRIKLDTASSFFGAIWFLSSFWLFQHYFSPQAISFMLFSLVFLLMTRLWYDIDSRARSRRLLIAIVVLFAATVFMHPLTPLFMLAGIFAIHILNRNTPKKFVTHSIWLLLLIWLTSLMHASYPFLVRAVSEVHEVLSDLITYFQYQIHRVTLTGSFYHSLTLGVRLFSVAINAIVLFFVILHEFRNRETKRRNIYWLTWLIGFGTVGLLYPYGSEMIMRVYMFALIPVSYLCITFLASKPKILYFSLVLLTFLNIPASYGGESFELITTTELVGASFYSQYAPENASYIVSRHTWRILMYYSPLLVKNEKFVIAPENITSNISSKNLEYLVHSDSTDNSIIFYNGFNPLEAFFLGLDSKSNRIYDNQLFKIYGRVLERRLSSVTES